MKLLYTIKGEHRQRLEAIKAKWPSKTSVQGSLLAEILSEESFQDRLWAADLFMAHGFRRGMATFRRLIDNYEARSRQGDVPPSVYDSLPNDSVDEVKFLEMVFQAIARMNTVESHAVLIRIAEEYTNQDLKDAALDAMAFEDDFFDLDFVIRRLGPENSWRTKVNALWAIMWHQSEIGEERLLRIVRPMFNDPDHNVRSHAIDALRYGVHDPEVFRPLVGDPLVGLQAAEAIRDTITMNEVEEATSSNS